MSTRLHCLVFLLAGLTVSGVGNANAQDYQPANPGVSPVIQSPLSPYTKPVDDGDARIETKVIDLNPIIEEVARKSEITTAKAKVETLTYLGLLVLQRVGQNPDFYSREIRPGVFEVTAPRSYHVTLPYVMESLRNGQRQICLELRIIQISEAELQKISGQLPRKWSTVAAGQLPLFRPVATDHRGPFRLASSSGKADVVTTSTRTVQELPARLMTLTAQESKDVMTHLRGNASTTVTAPRITLFPGQTGSISDATQRPFVVSVKPVVGDGGQAMQPVIQVVEEGVVMRIRPEFADGQIQVSSDIAFSQIKDVETFTFVPDETNEETTIQLPRQEVRQVHLAKRLDDNSTLLVDPHFFKESKSRGMFGRETTSRERIILMISVLTLEG